MTVEGYLSDYLLPTNDIDAGTADAFQAAALKVMLTIGL